MTPSPSERLADAREGSANADDRLLTKANVSASVMTIGKAIMAAVIILIVLGQLYATTIVAEPWLEDPPTATVTNESHSSVNQGELVSLNTTADYHYDDAPYAETVYNTTSGSSVEMTEGSGYEFYTNGTFEITSGTTGGSYDVTYSYYQQNTFQALTATFATYGETAYIMVGLGLIALGASIALSYFGGFGGRGGR